MTVHAPPPDESMLSKKVEQLEEEEKVIGEELQDIKNEISKIEERLKEAATNYEVNKFRIHGSDIEKIVSLILCLSGRLVKILSALKNMEWNGVEETCNLETKRDKLKEAKTIWHNILKRTRVVIGYIEKFLSRIDSIPFSRLLKRRIRTKFEIKKIQENIKMRKKQLELCGSETVSL